MRHPFHLAGAIATVFATLAAAPPTLGAQSPEPYPGFDAYVRAALQRWHVPGVSIAIVRNDSVISAKGYGVCDVGTGVPVDERTIFAIGSLTKAMTATAAAMLVEEGKLNFDAPVTAYLPDFQLGDPATRGVTLRDLLSHRTGVAGAELPWYGSGASRDEIVRRARYLPAAVPFRSGFVYSNIMYLTAGQVVARAAGTSWDDVVKSRIFTPLGMTSTSTSIRDLATRNDVATPHAYSNARVRAVPWHNADNIGPAGSINSNAVDMAQWLRFQLSGGTYAGRRLLSEGLIETMRTPQTVMPVSALAKRLDPSQHFQAYGMGWMVSDRGGRLLVQHSGGIDGMSSLIMMVPEERFGIVILTNLNEQPFMPSAIALRALDQQLKRAPRDWSDELASLMEAREAERRAAEAALVAQRIRGTHPSLPLAAYAGTYADSGYGEIRITEDRGTLAYAFGPTWRGTLEHWHFDTFHAHLTNAEPTPFTLQFRLDPAGSVTDLFLDAGAAGATTFRRIQPASSGVATAGRQGDSR